MTRKIEIVAVGKLREAFWREAFDEYAKRLAPYTTLTVTEVPERDPVACEGQAVARMIEGRDILKAVGERYAILLDIGGTERSSEDFSAHLGELAVGGTSEIVFVVGGPTGVDAAVREWADETMSFGPITLPHALARVVLAEQVYRAFKIMRGEPYHK